MESTAVVAATAVVVEEVMVMGGGIAEGCWLCTDASFTGPSDRTCSGCEMDPTGKDTKHNSSVIK